MTETDVQRIHRERIARQLRMLPARERPDPTLLPWPPHLRIRVLEVLEYVRTLQIDPAIDVLIELDLELGLIDHDIDRSLYGVRCRRTDVPRRAEPDGDDS